MRYLDFSHSPTGNGSTIKERLILCLDSSPSMEDTDWPPSRLDAAREAAEALLRRKRQIAPDDEVGIIAYSSSAHVLCEPLSVACHFRKLADALGGMHSGSGTCIASGLHSAQKLLSQEAHQSWWDRLMQVPPPQAPDRVHRVVLLTDGHHNTVRKPKTIARKLKGDGCCIDCIGIGGEPAAVDEPLLRQIASRHADGHTPRYVFIGDKSSLIQKFEQLAGRITR